MKLLMMIAALFFSSSQVKAQQVQDPQMMEKRREMAEQRFKEFSDMLALNADQQVKIKAIIKQNRMEMKQIREAQKDAPKEERRSAMTAQLKKSNDQINTILDPHQQELYKQYKADKKAERQKKMQERGDNGDGKEPIEDGLF